MRCRIYNNRRYVMEKNPSFDCRRSTGGYRSVLYVYRGHVDSWYYGAIDNGTANAAQMEVARLVSAHQKELKRNFRIVHYSVHSHGRYAGSARYADNFWEELHKKLRCQC